VARPYDRAQSSFGLVDLLVGAPVGSVASPLPLPTSSTTDTWAALEAALLPALTHPPAVVAFSGGVDSSLVLAAAASMARVHGLADPVPATLQFPSATWSNEDEWQAPVIASLGLTDWERVELDQDLDLLGDLATGILDRHGLYYPANSHSMVPLARLAKGGTLVTGVGGDDVLREWRWRRRGSLLRQLSARSIKPTGAGWRRWGTAALGTLPPPLRSRVLHERRRRSLHDPSSREFRWLRAEGRRLVEPALAERDDQPVRWDEFVSWVDRRRTTMSYRTTLETIGDDHGAAVCSPLIDPYFLGALATAGGRWGYPDRAAAVAAIAGDRLPQPTAARVTKAAFHEVFCGPRSKLFAREWDGCGVDDRLVDTEALRREWLSDHPDFRSMWLLHSVWMGQRVAEAERPS
jgi:asparagine synthase (glutamine-hydrolysing)